MDRSVPFFIAFYALLVIVLGIMGYQYAGSMISLISGVVLGILLLISVYFMSRRQAWAYYFGTFLSLILLVVFCIRFGATYDFMPGAMAILSLIAGIVLVNQGIKLSKK